MRQYKKTRARGLAPWRPQGKSLELLEQVRAVFLLYTDFLPLTVRQVFYSLVGRYDYSKDELAYDRLGEMLNRARRAGLLPFEWMRDDGWTVVEASSFHGLPDYWSAVRSTAESYKRDRSEGQAYAYELWVEAAGMMPQLQRVANPLGVPVYSSGGFDSTTVKREAAVRVVERDRPTIVFHVGDWDPSGMSIFDSAAEDVAQFASDMGEAGVVEFRHAVVTKEQIADYGLPEKPAKATDKRGNWQGGTVQAEALSPPDLAAEVTRALDAVIDADALASILDTERREREELLAALDGLGYPGDPEDD